jgi:Holliday junction resolvase
VELSNYTRGRAKEYAFMKQLREDGYTALRTAGSHGDWDVIFYKNEGTLQLAQLKYTEDGKVTKNELKRFDEAPLPKDSRAYLVTYKKGQSEPFRIFIRTCREARRTYIRDGDDETWL